MPTNGVAIIGLGFVGKAHLEALRRLAIPVRGQLFNDFYAYLDAGDFSQPGTFPTFETGHEEMRLCEAIAKSAKERKWLKLD